MNRESGEHGQALVLIVLALLGMFAFAALAIDGGMLYSQRASAQNALSGGNHTTTFAPGVYCIENGLVLTLANVSGSNVFFYIKSGEVRIQGSADVSLSAGTNIPGDSAGAYNNQLIYMPYANNNLVRITGGSDLDLSGRIYAPGPRSTALGTDQCGVENAPYQCELVGNSDTATINSQIMCDTVRVKGTAELTMTYNDPLAGAASITFELYK